jgi:hypothetical protein
MKAYGEMKGVGTRTGVGVRPLLGSWYMSCVDENPLRPGPAAVTKAWGTAAAVREDPTVEEASEA